MWALWDSVTRCSHDRRIKETKVAINREWWGKNCPEYSGPLEKSLDSFSEFIPAQRIASSLCDIHNARCT